MASLQNQSISERFGLKMLVLLVGFCLWNPLAIAADSPLQVVRTGTEQVLSILMKNPQDTQARREQIQAVLDRYFDFESMARFSLGPQWRSLSPEQQQEFTREFRALLFKTYMGDIEKYARLRMSYRTTSTADNRSVVEALLNFQGNPVSLDYSLHLKDGQWKVYDVAVQGMSLAVNYRNQFGQALASGSFQALSNMMKRQIAGLCAPNQPC